MVHNADALAFDRRMARDLVGGRLAHGDDEVGAPRRGVEAATMEPTASAGVRLGEHDGGGVVHRDDQRGTVLPGRNGDRRSVDNVQIAQARRLGRQRGPTEHIPRVVQQWARKPRDDHLPVGEPVLAQCRGDVDDVVTGDERNELDATIVSSSWQ